MQEYKAKSKILYITMYVTIIGKKSKDDYLQKQRRSNLLPLSNYHIALTDKNLLEQVERDPVVAEGPNCPPAKLTFLLDFATS